VVFDNATRTYESFDSEPITADWVLGVSADEHHAEVVAFVSFIYDVLARISEGRGRPPLSSYLNSQTDELTNQLASS
jgi:hypothetical protein